jgi:hypothetical protein
LLKAQRVEDELNPTEKERLIDLYGIKGLPAILKLQTLRYPFSFPVDVMHIAFINVSKHVARHFGGIEYKTLIAKKKKANKHIPATSTKPSYIMSDASAKSLERDMKSTAKATPSCWGAVVPYLYDAKGAIKAEHWQIWTTILSSALLYERIDNGAIHAWRAYVNAISLSIAAEIPLPSIVMQLNNQNGGSASYLQYSASCINDK